MTIDASAQIDAGERATLPPLRSFGETNTLTLPRAPRTRIAGRTPSPAADVAAEAGGRTHVAVVAADSTPLTLTF